MATRSSKKSVGAKIRKGITNPSSSETIVIYFLGSILGGILLGIGISLGQKIVDKLSQEGSHVEKTFEAKIKKR